MFTRKVREIIRNINLGKPVNRSDNKKERWKVMALVAMGQSKMLDRPVAAILHIFIYVGFIIINVEVLEIIIDGLFGTHRILSFMGSFYNFLIGSFEILALLVLVACVIFLIRRNVLYIKRFHNKELTAWPKSDANIILVSEILLMTAFLTMDAADSLLQARGVEHYVAAGAFPVSMMISSFLSNMSTESLIMLERICWWFHITGILIFLNYVPYSKHFHIFLAFPNTYYSNLNKKGRFNNMSNVTHEVNMMLHPETTSADAPPAEQGFGAKDVRDLNWKQLMDSYSCTECGRCTSVCPANITGKALSPRKIMMDTRDRLEETGKNIDAKGIDFQDGKALFGDYITSEEILACTTCNACVEACPINIDPLSIIIDIRRYMIMEQSAAPAEWNGMFNKIENNGAPWQFSPADRLNWKDE